MKKSILYIALSAVCAFPTFSFAATTTYAQVPLQLHAIVPGGTQSAPAQAPVAPPPIGLDASSGNILLQHLQTLFVLDELFADSSGGLLTPGPVTLHNLIVLYELFYGTEG